jgi:hypothetical protein
MDRTFTLGEAQALLPVLESLLKRAIEGKKRLQEFEEEFQAIAHRIFLNGGTLVDVSAVRVRKQQRDRELQQVKDAVAEIDSIGVQVKDLDMGLLDFPCEVEGEILLLCWKLGEEKIEYWHGLEEGYRGRKPIDERIRKGDRPS